MARMVRWGIIGVGAVLVAVSAWYFVTRTSGRSAFGPSQVHISIAPLAEQVGDFEGRVVPLAIIGSGPAGLSAAVYGARFNIHTVVFEGKNPGGQLMGTSDVENWPGIGRELGSRIIDRIKNQALQFGALMSSQTVEAIELAQWPYQLKLDDGSLIYALSIILATGAAPKLLDVPGEQAYWGKGVTACAVCDAPFFRDRTVVVVGGGDAAAEEALQLASYAQSITVLVRAESMRASYAMQQRLKAYPKISVRYKTQVKEILGDGSKVTGIQIETAGARTQMAVDGVFLAIGHTPNTGLVKGRLACDEQGYLQVDGHRQHTSQAGVFAAGDVADRYYRQAGVAAGDGIKAALDAAAFLREHGMDDAALGTYAASFFNPQSVSKLPEIMTVATMEEFEQMLREHKLLVVDFYTPQCPACKQLLPHLAAAQQLYHDDLMIVKVDGAELTELMERYEVTAVPTLLVFKKGIVVGRSTSISSRRDVQAFIGQFVD
jgi:thioredoxin reductase (NADPH)